MDLPIQLTVLSRQPEETYSACPFCFSRVNETKVEAPVEPAVEPVVVKPLLGKKQERGRKKEDVEDVTASVGGCSHHLGYLRERAKNTPVPDECLVCPKVLQCMI